MEQQQVTKPEKQKNERWMVVGEQIGKAISARGARLRQKRRLGRMGQSVQKADVSVSVLHAEILFSA